MNNKESAIQQVIRKIETFIHSLSNMEEYEQKILQAILEEQGYEELRSITLSLTEYHVIDCIGRNDQINTTAIAQKLAITKGGISKITAKLIKKNLIAFQHMENNQKEIYYTLKPLGEKVFHMHKVFHALAAEQFSALLSGYSEKELQCAEKIVGDLAALFTAIQFEKQP